MTSDLTFLITQIFAAVALIVSLINLGIEIRKSRNESIRDSVDLITKERGEFIKILATDEDLAKIMAKALIKDGEMNDLEEFRFASYLYHLFVHWELAHRKWTRGNVDNELWESWVEAIQWWLKKPKVVKWWQYNDIGGFTEPFMEFIENQTSELNNMMIEKEQE